MLPSDHTEAVCPRNVCALQQLQKQLGHLFRIMRYQSQQHDAAHGCLAVTHREFAEIEIKCDDQSCICMCACQQDWIGSPGGGL